MKGILSLLVLFIIGTSGHAQKEKETNKLHSENNIATRPKLVVGIVVDQMRYDYLVRFYNKFEEGGFKRMLNEGYNCKNNHFNYIPTFTGPGHASVYTGTTPKYHGIIANNWYDKFDKKSVYCARDFNRQPIGTTDEQSGISPHRMLVTTVTDELRLATQMQGKVIGIALKDRGAALPAGHTANAAYWFQGKEEGNWVSSSFYMNELPVWVKTFNKEKIAKTYFKIWDTMYDIKTYTESGSDINTFEQGFKTKASYTSSFPYDLKALRAANGDFDILKATPYGNNLTLDFALAAIKGEQLGSDAITDFLAVSFSSTDYVGHNFGVNSKEIEDTYIRLDKDLARLFSTLDARVGKGEYTVFLTADHGAVDVPSYLQTLRIPAGYFDLDAFKGYLNAFMLKTFGANDLVEDVSNFQIFLNRKKLQKLDIDLDDAQETIVNEIINYPQIDKAYTATSMNTASFTNGVELLIQNGYNQKRSGDILAVLSPNIISYGRKGSTHGSGLNHDTHVPLLFYGKGIAKGSTVTKTRIIDIAPTISALLGISFPNGATGQPLEFVLE